MSNNLSLLYRQITAHSGEIGEQSHNLLPSDYCWYQELPKTIWEVQGCDEKWNQTEIDKATG